MITKVLAYVVAVALLFGCAAPRAVTAPIGYDPKEYALPLLPEPEPVAPTEVVLHLDTDFTPAEREYINAAAEQWRKQTAGLADIALVYDLDFASPIGLGIHVQNDHHMVIRATSDMDSVHAIDGSEPGCTLGWMTSGGIHNDNHVPVRGDFIVDRMASNHSEMQVVVHEFGHVLGLHHSENPADVMFAGTNNKHPTCLTTHDLKAFCDANPCDARPMVACD